MVLTAFLMQTPGAAGDVTGRPAKIVAIRAGRLLDGNGGPARTRQVVVIEGERIRAVGNEGDVQVPESAQVIELPDATVLPGLIDCHTHLSSRADRFDEIRKFKETPFQGAFAAVLHA